MKVADLVAVMKRLAPLEYAESWDKVGLLIGSADRELKGPVLLTIDLSEAVIDEADRVKAGAVIAYHPPVWEPLARVTDATPRQRVVMWALERGLAGYSPHTALDAVPGGVTDWLCEGLSGGSNGRILGDVRALRSHAERSPTREVKIVTFVPRAELDRVRDALASAGAGIIGQYVRCSFATPGQGSFVPGEGSRPHVGVPGRLERVDEMRLEMVCSKAALPLAIETMRRFHPYEEPAIDIVELQPIPRRSAGSGRRLVLDKPATARELAERLKAWVGRNRASFATAGREDVPITRVGVVPGSGEGLSRLARDEGCEVFVTGEMKHHEVLGALNAGMGVVLGGHTATERGYLPRLRDRLAKEGVEALVSQADREPLITI